MGRETYTYRLNAEKMRTNLVKLMENGRPQKVTFSDFLLNVVNPQRHRCGPNMHPSLDANEIINALSDVQHLATASYLGVVFDWLDQISDPNPYSEDEFFSTLSNYGFELVYELEQSDKCWVYGNQISEYEHMNDVERDSDCCNSCYYLYPGTHYKNCLDYLLMLLSKICLDREYKNREIDYSAKELSFLKDYRYDEVLDKQTEQALKEIRIENEEEDIAEKNDSNYRRNNTMGHYYVAEHMFYQIKEVQQMIAGYDGKIFVSAS